MGDSLWYGERLRRWAACTFILVASFTVIYQVEYQLGGHLKVTDVCWVDWLTPLYFAAVTTATLGYGDIHAESWLAQLSVIANIFGGYVLLWSWREHSRAPDQGAIGPAQE